MNKRKGKKKLPVAERNYKDTLFRMIFREPEAYEVLVEEPAQELEEDKESIRQLCEIAAAYAPEYDSSQVFEALMKV